MQNSFAQSVFKSIKINNLQLDILYPADFSADCNGNKIWKLEPIVINAKQQNIKKISSIGGAYSNSILALAHLGVQYNIQTKAYIRGEELTKTTLNPILDKAQNKYGMQLEFISRNLYRQKYKFKTFIEQQTQLTNEYFIEEGGANLLGYYGVKNFFKNQLNSKEYSEIYIPVGTGTSVAGLASAVSNKTQIKAVLIVKDLMNIKKTIINFLSQDYKNKLDKIELNQNKIEFLENYTFGGFAKKNKELNEFIINFSQKYTLPLDYRYSGKMFYALMDQIQSMTEIYNHSNKKILAIHTGGDCAASTFNNL